MIEPVEQQEETETLESGGIESKDPLGDDIAKTWAAIEAKRQPEVTEDVTRDANGKFAEPEVEALTDEVDAPIVEPVTEDVVIEKKAAPDTWHKTAAAEWEKLPPRIQDEVLKRENDMRHGIKQYKAKAAVGDNFERAVAPFMATIQSMGIEPLKAVTEMMTADHRLRYGSPQEKLAYFAHLAQSYNIDLNAVPQSQQTQVDPNVAYLQQQVQSLSSAQAKWEQDRQAQAEQTLTAQIADFAKDKEHFADVADEMVLQIGAARAAGQSLSLQTAYDKACLLTPQVQAAMQAKQLAAAKADAAKRAKEAKDASSTNVNVRGKLPPTPVIGSMDDTIRANAKRLGLA